MQKFKPFTAEQLSRLTDRQLQRYELLLRQEIADRKNYPLLYFVPTNPQMDMFRAIASRGKTTKRRLVLTCSNRNGKSTGIMASLAAIVTDSREGAFSIFPPWEYEKKVWIVANKDNVKENLLDIFEKYIAGQIYTATKDGKNYNSHYYFPKTGFNVYVKTYGQTDDNFEATTVGLLVFDEPPKQSIWDVCKSRLMQGGMLLMGATPLFGAGYLYNDAVLKSKQPNSIYWHKEAAIYENIQDDGYWYVDKSGRLVFLDKYDEIIPVIQQRKNIAQGYLPGVWTRQELIEVGYTDPDALEMLTGEHKGNLPLFEIKQAIAEFDEESYEARVFGRFKFLSGAVYKKWADYRPNIVRLIGPPNHHQRYIYRMIIDPHDRRPPAVCWLRIDQFNTSYIIREWPGVDDSCYGHRMFHKITSSEPYILKDWIAMWIRIEKQLGIVNTDDNRIKCVMDPNFGRKPNSVTGINIYQEYQNEFARQGSPRVVNTSVNDDLTAGHEAVRRLLKPTGHGEQKLIIDQRCKNIQFGLSNYMFDDWTGVNADKKSLRETIQDKYKDFPDLVRYHAMMPIHFPPVPAGQEARDYHAPKPVTKPIQDVQRRLAAIKSGKVRRPY